MLLQQVFLSFKGKIAEITRAEVLKTKLNDFISFNLFYTKKYISTWFNIV